MLADGEYANAMNMFRRDLNDAYHFGQSRWIDSICSYTMLGESQYRIGDYRDALENFENAHAALQSVFQLDAAPCSFPPRSGRHHCQGPPWGKSNRGSRPARFPETFQIAMGMSNADVINTLHTGGPVVPAQLLSINAGEIVRCTCLAMQRRKQILGPLVVHDSLTDEVLGQTAKRRVSRIIGRKHGSMPSKAWPMALPAKRAKPFSFCSDRSPWGRGSSIIP